MSTATAFALLVAVIVAYVLLAGLAFVAIYRWPGVVSSALCSQLFAPLDALARHFTWFARFYNGFQHWCHRNFVGDSRGDH